MPPETQGVVIIDGHRCESSWIANKVTVGRYGADFNVIQDAIDYCDAIGGEWTILIYPRGEAGAAFYNEGDITPSGAAIITLKGMGEDRVQIAPTVAPATAVIVSAGTLNIEDIIVTAPTNAFPAVRVTAGTFGATSCELNGVGAGDAIQQVGGTVTLHDCRVPVGDIDLRDAACTITIEDCNINGTLDTADGAGAAVVMTVTVRHCDCNNQAFNLAATGACVYEFHSNNEMGAITDASLGAGAVNGEICRCHVGGAFVKNGTTGWLLDNSEVLSINNANAVGGITFYGGILVALVGATGSFVWWLDSNTLRVIPSGTVTDTVIQWAVNAATLGDTIVLHPGTYTEPVVLAAGINLVGIDKKGCLLNVADGTTGIVMADGCRVANFTILVTASGGNTYGISCNNDGPAANPLYIENLNINLVRTGANAYGIVEFTGNATNYIYVRNVRVISDTDTNEAAIYCDQANKTFYIEECWLQGGDYALRCSADSIFYVGQSHLEVNVIPPGGGTTISCLAATMWFKGCTIEKQISAGDLGTVRLRNCSYREINRTGTGNIVDESPVLMDAPWKVHKWTWQAALANAQVAVRGTPIDAGTGQVLLEVTDDSANVEAVESLPVAAGALGNEFTPARTPRFLTQISVDSFDTHVTMFFGLRETLGNAVPAATEHHAGFVWNGANFQASSDDGVATQTANLTTPTTGVHVQLEVIIFGGVTTVGWVEFYIDGVLVATHSTRIPVNGLDWQHLLATVGAGGGDEIDVTVRNGGTVECPA